MRDGGFSAVGATFARARANVPWPNRPPGANGEQPGCYKFVEHGERVEDQQEQQLPAGAGGFLYNGSTCVSQIRGPADPSIPGRVGPTTGVLETRVTTSAVSPDTRAHAGANSRIRQLFFLLLFLRLLSRLPAGHLLSGSL